MPEEDNSTSIFKRWQNRLEEKLADISLRQPESNILKSRHFWIILGLMAVGVFVYYVDQTSLAEGSFFSHPFFTSVHDLHRTLFFLPVLYAAVAFRIPGALITSLAFLSIVVPRALIYSPYPDPLVRPILFVAFALLISLLLAAQLNRMEFEHKANAKLNKAYDSLKDSQEQLIQAEKLSSLGQLAACLAHEINNPLAGVLAYSQLLIRKMEDGNVTKEQSMEYLSKIDTEIRRTSKLVHDMLDFSRHNPPELGQVDINDVVKQSLCLVDHAIKVKHIRLVKNLTPSPPPIQADFHKLIQVITNLALNSVQSMSQRGTLVVSTSVMDGELKLTVKDDGAGITPEDMKKLFTPFFTTKREEQGVGLGLAVAYGIIQQHNGRIEVESKVGEGSIFKIYLPTV